jgi:TRAP-type C4-dicarboxylate transport system permease small subunit
MAIDSGITSRNKIIHIFLKATDKLADLLGTICWVLVVTMLVLILWEVFMRYVLNNPPLIADELSAYFLVAIVFLGLALTWKEGSHVRVDALINILPDKITNPLRLITLFLDLVLVAGVFYGSLVYIERAFIQNPHSDSWMRFPLKWIQLTMVIGFCSLGIQIVASLFKGIIAFRAGKNLERRPE